jgi:hypothetical protein
VPAVPGSSAVPRSRARIPPCPASRCARQPRRARVPPCPRRELLAQTVAALWEALAAAVNPLLSPEQLGLPGRGFEYLGKLWVPRR